MKLLVRAMLNKHGTRDYVVFTDESGISKPIAIIGSCEMSEFIRMFYEEQAEMDRYVVNKGR